MNELVQKYKKLSLPVKAGLWYTASNIIQRGISIITSPIFTRILTTEEYGMYSTYLSWQNLLSIFTCLNLYYGVFNKAMVKYPEDRDGYISSMQGLVLALCMLFTVLYIPFRDVFNSLFELSTVVVVMMIIEMAVTPMMQFWAGKNRFEYKYINVVTVTLVLAALSQASGVALVLISRQGAEARILANTVVEVVICGTIMVRQFRRNKAFFSKKYWSYALKFNIPLIPHYLSGSVLNQSDRIIIQKICGATSVALYSVGYSVSMLSQLVTNAISQAITPWMYECLTSKRYDEIDKKLRPIMFFVALLCFALMLFAPEVVWLFASEQYAESVYVIPPIAASVFFIYMYNVYSNFEFYFEKRGFIMVASLVSAVLNIILNLLFIPIYGYVAASFTTLICYVAYSFGHYFFSAYLARVHADGAKVFRFGGFAISSLLVLTLSVCSMFLYWNTLIRYTVIVVLAACCLLFRTRIIGILKSLR